MNYQSVESLPQPLPQETLNQKPFSEDQRLLDQSNSEEIGNAQSEQDGALAKLQQDYLAAFTDSNAFQQSSGNTADLPPFTLASDDFSPANDATQPDHPQESGGVFPVVGDIIGGAVTHVIQHPGDVLMSAATGIALSAAVGTAAGIIAVTAPAWVTVAGTVALVGAGLGLLGIGVAAEAPELIANAQTVFDPSAHTADEVAKAHEGLQEFAGDAVDFTAGLVGGGAVFKQASTFASKMFGKPAVAGAEAATVEASAAAAAEASATAEASAATAASAVGDVATAAKAQLLTGLKGEELITALRVTAEQEGERSVIGTAVKYLSNPADIAEFADQYAGMTAMDFIKSANYIRRTPFFSDERALMEPWLKAAEVFETKALPLMRESAGKQSFWNKLSPTELRNEERMLAGLESGLKADRLIGDVDAANLAINNPGQAVSWIGRPGEIESFLDEYRFTHPNFRAEVEVAIKSGVIPSERAAQWKTALSEIPESPNAAIASIVVDGSGPKIFQAVEEAAQRSILPTEQYALLHLKNPDAIKSFAAEWDSKFPNKDLLAMRIMQALDNKMVQPRTENDWVKAMEFLGQKVSNA